MGEVWRARDTRLNREVAIKWSAGADPLLFDFSVQSVDSQRRNINATT
jgi:hypothetical protein